MTVMNDHPQSCSVVAVRAHVFPPFLVVSARYELLERPRQSDRHHAVSAAWLQQTVQFNVCLLLPPTMSSHPAFVFGVLTLFLLATQVNHVSCGSCRESKLCCPGRDSSCVVQKAPINAIIEDLSDKPCYCDHACLKLGDCCPDFKDACGGKCLQTFWWIVTVMIVSSGI